MPNRRVNRDTNSSRFDEESRTDRCAMRYLLDWQRACSIRREFDFDVGPFSLMCQFV
jgi:hypothetical protein